MPRICLVASEASHQTANTPHGKAQGGGDFGLPDMKAYNRASHLTRRHSQELVLDTTPLAKALVDHPTLGSTIQVARDTLRQSSISPLPSPMVPILGNLDFLPGCQGPIYRSLSAWGGWWPHLHYFLGPNGQLTAAAGLEDSNPPLDFLSGLQLRNYLRHCTWTLGSSRPLTELEQICHRREPTRHSLSLIYSSLISPVERFIPPFLSKWEEDLGVRFDELQREKILHFAQKSSLATRVQETCYKIVTRWYRVPSTLHWFFPQVPSLCWRCGVGEGTMFHIFWDCPKINPTG